MKNISAIAIKGVTQIDGIKWDFKSPTAKVNGWVVKGTYLNRKVDSKLRPATIEKGITSGRFGAQAIYTIKICGKQIVSETSLERCAKAFENILSIFC